MVPSIATIAIGMTILAALAVVDWFVWRMAPVLPYPLARPGPRSAASEAAVALKEVA
jgi:hypothetical protein